MNRYYLSVHYKKYCGWLKHLMFDKTKAFSSYNSKCLNSSAAVAELFLFSIFSVSASPELQLQHGL